LGNKFNQPLGNSFINLTNLHSLTFGQNFGVDLDSLEDSLITLTNLKNLTIKDNDLIKKSLEELRRINPTLTIHLLK
jgi:Leucine-rich repeat (LRR) protein